MAGRGQRLDGLAQAHLVAQDHPAAGEREPGAEGLIATQVDIAQPAVQRLGFDVGHHVVGEEAPDRIGGDAGRHELAEQRVVVGRPALEAGPRVGGRLASRLLQPGEAVLQPVLVRLAKQLLEPARRSQRGLAMRSTGEEPAEGVAGRTRGGQFRRQPYHQFVQQVGQPGGFPAQQVVAVERLQEAGRGAVGGIQLDPEPGLLRQIGAHPVGGCSQRPSGDLPDAVELGERCLVGQLSDRGVAGGQQWRKVQPAL